MSCMSIGHGGNVLHSKGHHLLRQDSPRDFLPWHETHNENTREDPQEASRLLWWMEVSHPI